MRQVLKIALYLLVISMPAWGNLSLLTGTLQGRVINAQKMPIVGAQIKLENFISGYSQILSTRIDGAFTIYNIPSGSYHLEITKTDFSDTHLTIEISSQLPIVREITLVEAYKTILVEDNLAYVADAPMTSLDIDKSTIATWPSVTRTRGLESILMTTPGFTADENGRFHFRGSHGQSTYMVDGIPVSDKIQGTFSNTLNPEDLENIEVITAGIPAMYGGKPVAIFNLTSKSGLGLSVHQGSVTTTFGSFNTQEQTASSRWGSDRFGYFVSAVRSKSDRYLDPVNFENLNNSGTSQRFFTRWDFVQSDTNSLRVNLSYGESTFGIPNLTSQESRLQKQGQTNKDANLSVTWSHIFDATSGLIGSAFVRQSNSWYRPTANLLTTAVSLQGPDYPAWIRYDRTLKNRGLTLSYTKTFEDGTFSVGLEAITFPIYENISFFVEEENANLAAPKIRRLHFDKAPSTINFQPGNFETFNQSITPTLRSAFSQWEGHYGSLTAAIGVRFDSYTQRSGQDAVSEVQPRLGVSYKLSEWNTIFKASYDRLMIIPDNEFLAISSVNGVLKPELQNSLSLGTVHQLADWGKLTLEYWEKQSVNSADSEQLFNTGVLFPVHAQKGNFRGWNMRFDLRRNEYSGFVSAGKTRAIFVAPLTGGLLLEEAELSPGTSFLIDHDQELSAQTGLRYQTSTYWAQVIGRYDSGLISGDPGDSTGSDTDFGIDYVREVVDPTFGLIYRIKPRTLWSLGVGYQLKNQLRHDVELSLDMTNLFNVKGLYNFLSVFGGTHVIPPRAVNFRVRYRF